MKTIDDLLKTNGHRLWSVAPDASVDNAIQLMAGKQVAAIPVLQDRKLVGVITEQDCLQNVSAKGKSTKKTRVKEVMRRTFVSTSPAQTVENCLDVMAEKQVRHLPVISDDSLVGFVSMNDLLRIVIADQKEYIYRLENYILGINLA